MGRNTKEKILAAAAAEFAEKGFAGATTRSIAERAGVNEVTLFRNFGTKQDLLAAVLEAGKVLPGTSERLFRELEGMEPSEALLSVARNQAAMLRGGMPWLRMRLMNEHPEERQPSLFGYRRSLAEFLRGLQQAGKIGDGMDAAVAAELFASSVLGWVLAQDLIFRTADALDEEECLKAYVTMFLRGMEVR